jgi:hypothetical protein
MRSTLSTLGIGLGLAAASLVGAAGTAGAAGAAEPEHMTATLNGNGPGHSENNPVTIGKLSPQLGLIEGAQGAAPKLLGQG